MMKSQTKVIIRNLPRSMTKEQFFQEIGNNYRYNYLRFCETTKYNKISSTRAYINFLNEDDMYAFKNIMESTPFVDDIGNETYCIVEFSVFQKIPGKSKVDSKQNTIATDPDFIKYTDDLKQPAKHVNIGSVESNLEEIKNKESDRINIKTPLIEFLSNIPKKERTKKEEYRRKPEYAKTYSKKDAENNDSKLSSKVEIKSAKKSMAKEGLNDVAAKNDSAKLKSADKADTKKNKVNQRNDIKMYAAAYEDYEYESWEKRGFDNNNKSYRSGRAGAYDGDDKGAYYGYGGSCSRNVDAYYRSGGGGYGYTDYCSTAAAPSQHAAYSRAPPQAAKGKRGGIRRPPAYSTTRKD